jgi:hypothetical protein
MSNVRVTLDCVQVTDGQGVGEGNLELRIQVLESIPLQGSLAKVIWPSLNTTEEVNNNGTIRRINQVVDTYPIGSTGVTKNFRILVDEEDTGTLGQDEFGQALVAFELTPDMCRTTRSALITLRNNGGNEGQVRVTLAAQSV